MKILCLSDLHISRKLSSYEKQYRWIKECLEDKPDVIVVAGDVFDGQCQTRFNPYKYLNELFEGITTICTFGNHEFVRNTVDNVKKYYKEQYDKKYDVYYLDIIKYFDIGDIRFLGNVLWYDGSLSNMFEQDLSTFADGRWLDKTIKDFDFIKENKICVDEIKESIDISKTNILCTHCVPHYQLNVWYDEEKNDFNAFSGMYDLLKDIDVQYAICGHTHRRIVGRVIHGCECINTGNDYYEPFSSYLLEI